MKTQIICPQPRCHPWTPGGHSVLLEIQATLKEPPKASRAMMQGVSAAYVVVVVAYFAVAATGALFEVGMGSRRRRAGEVCRTGERPVYPHPRRHQPTLSCCTQATLRLATASTPTCFCPSRTPNGWSTSPTLWSSSTSPRDTRCACNSGSCAPPGRGRLGWSRAAWLVAVFFELCSQRVPLPACTTERCQCAAAGCATQLHLHFDATPQCVHTQFPHPTPLFRPQTPRHPLPHPTLHSPTHPPTHAHRSSQCRSSRPGRAG